MENDQNHPVPFGKYQILEELGRGGFGIVYRAFDTVLEVERAIKELYPNLVNDPAFVNRFKQEARIAARLDHPNLVPVHDFGQIDGKYYLSMGYMPGGSLKELIKREGPLSKERALEILQQIGAGLSYAHNQGVIHRDLKPGNILFDAKGQARVGDLGFAKLMHSKSSGSMSTSGGLVGTPAYMAPEIWRGKAASAATDIYSLACILVEMLTAKPLFDGESTPEVMFKHFEPLQLPEDLPEEWQPAIEKALEKEPEDRLGTVDELVSWLQQAEQRATPTVPEEGESKDQKAQPEPVKEATTTSDAVVSEQQDQKGQRAAPRSQVVDQTPFQSTPDIGEEHIQPAESIDDDTPKTSLGIRQGKPNIPKRITSLFRGKPGDEHPLAPDEQTKAKAKSIQGIPGKTGKPIALAGVGIILVLIVVLVWTLGPPKGLGLPAAEVTSQPTETDVATSTLRATITSTKTMAPSLTPTRTLQPTATMTPTPIILLGSTAINSSNVDQVEQLRTLEGHLDLVFNVAWSPDGKTLASGGGDMGGDGTIILWDMESRNQLRTLEGHTDFVDCVSWSPDGKTLASGSSDNTIILWDAGSGSQLRTLKEYGSGVMSVSWSPDGKTLASGEIDGTIILWDIESRSQLRTLKGHRGEVMGIAWSPDGKTLASGGSDETVRLWDVESDYQFRFLRGHASVVYRVAWSPDGKTLASVSWDETVILWDIEIGAKLRTLERHTHGVESVAWSPDGKTLASGGENGVIILWDADNGNQLRTLEGHMGSVWSVAWSPDGKTLASGSWDGTIRLWGIP